jgi:hypothetical protein
MTIAPTLISVSSQQQKSISQSQKNHTRDIYHHDAVRLHTTTPCTTQRKFYITVAYAVAAGAAFLGVVAFFAAGFLGAAFFTGVVLLVVLVTRPDLVLPRTAGLSTTAGAYSDL